MQVSFFQFSNGIFTEVNLEKTVTKLSANKKCPLNSYLLDFFFFSIDSKIIIIISLTPEASFGKSPASGANLNNGQTESNTKVDRDDGSITF